VFPRKFIPQRKSRIHYGRCAANGTTSSLTDDCLLASTWNYAGTTRHATPRRRTTTTNFQHLWRQTSLYGSRNKSQTPSSPHPVTRLPDNLDRTFKPLYASKCSSHHRRLHLPKPRVPVITSPSPHASTPKQQSPRGVVWKLPHGG
jgi:hypothetical protein